jgi:tRNA 2-thiouridine synthesizing protein A
MEKLDVRGKMCPFPLFYTKRKITEMKSGEELEIIADDSTAKATIQKWSKLHNQEIIKIEDEETYFRIILKKRE